MPSAFAHMVRDGLQPGKDNVLAIIEKVEKGSATSRELDLYATFLEEFKRWQEPASVTSAAA